MMPTRDSKMMQKFKVTAFTLRNIEISRPLVITEICDPWKVAARHNQFYFILSKTFLIIFSEYIQN